MTREQIINCEKLLVFDKCALMCVNMAIDTNKNHLSKSSLRRNHLFIKDERLQVGETTLSL